MDAVCYCNQQFDKSFKLKSFIEIVKTFCHLTESSAWSTEYDKKILPLRLYLEKTWENWQNLKLVILNVKNILLFDRKTVQSWSKKYDIKQLLDEFIVKTTNLQFGTVMTEFSKFFQ